jgi:type I restriction enzyme S subunit
MNTPRMTVGALVSAGALEFGDGYRTKRSEHGLPGYRIIRVADVLDNVVQLDGPDFVSEQHVRAIGSKIGQPGDILLTTKGTVGRVAVMPVTEEPVVYSPQLCYFRVKDHTVINPQFLRYWFNSQEFWDQASYCMNNTDMAAYINMADIRSLEINLPSITDQQAIVEVLGALDDKIAANTKLIASTDSLAQTQFQAALKDSEAKPLSSLAQFVNGKAFTKGASGTGRVVARIAELNSGIGNSTVFSDAKVDDKHVVRPGDILFAWSGSLTLHRWFRDEAIVNQHIFKIIPTGETPDWLIYELLRNKLEDFKMIAADKATTMGHIQRKHLDEPVLVPNETILRDMAPNMDSLWRTALNTERENLTLATTRDVLLPQLMSGILRVREAEEILAAAV